MCRESRVFYCWDNTTFLAITNKPRGIASVKVVIAKIDILQLAPTTTKNKTTHNLIIIKFMWYGVTINVDDDEWYKIES